MKTLLRPAGAPDRETDASIPPAGRRRPAQGWEAQALLLLVGAAFCFGLVQLYSASAFLARSQGLPAHAYALRQLGGAAVGVGIAALLARVPPEHLRPLAWPFLGVVLLLLLVVVLPGTERIAPRVNGARRWIQLGVTVQPSELAKLALMLWTAALAVKKQDRLHSLRKGLLPFLLVWFATVLLVFLEPNLSAALLIALLAALVLFAGGARIGHFILLGILAVPVVWNRIQGASYRANRIVAFLDPTADPAGVSYQIRQSLIALGSGGVDGVGFGQSQQKFGFLPEPHNDFLFAMIGEEWGWVGVIFTVALFLGMALVGYRIARRAPDRFSYLLAVGMTNLLAVSAFLHMGVALALLPTTGVSLPFMSYGRSALLSAFAAVGVLLSVERVGRSGAG